MNVRSLLVALAGLSCAQAVPPTIFEALDPVRPDETLLLFGADVTPQATAEGLRLPDNPVTIPPATLSVAPPGKPGKLEMLQATDLSAKVLIPKSWKPGVYAVRVRNADGPGAWQFANRPQLWWQMSGIGGKATPGGELRVFGKNFGKLSRLWLVDAAGKSRELPVTVARDYDVTATLPASLPAGAYRLWLHNGHGGEAGFGEPLTLEVAPANPWPRTVFNVHDFGAKGDGSNDDTFALRRALEKAGAKGGGLVYLPAGTYVVTGKLVVPEYVTICGESADLVWIRIPAGTPEFDALFAGAGRFVIEQLSILDRASKRVVASPDISPTYAGAWANWNVQDFGLGGITLCNLRVRHLRKPTATTGKPLLGPTTIALNGPACSIEQCDIVSSGMPLQLASSRGLRVRDSRLLIGAGGWIGIWGFESGLLEGNEVTAAALDASYVGIEGATDRVCIRANRWHDAYGQYQEALTFDTPYFASWIGTDFQVKDAIVHLGKRRSGVWPPVWPSEQPLAAVITAGRGLGQIIPVLDFTTDFATLAHPFAIAPDSTSTCVLIARKSRVLVVDNDFADASVAVQLYSQAQQFIIAGNRSARTGGAYAMACDNAGTQPERYSYAFFNQWLDNTFAEGAGNDLGPFRTGFVGYAVERGNGVEKDSTPAIGNRFVGNQLTGGTQMGAIVFGNTPPAGRTPFGRDTIFEKNSISHQPIGIKVDSGHAATLLRDNHFDEVMDPVANSGSGTLILP